ncbi:MAG: thiamine pyrophosphate-dependent dehydrogenase E1 component subunit alpha [Sphaerochaetaceae bacterium]|jgi:TPP-dependent pyruvate/acetoin dehydrogenase alpha subunit
MIVGAFVLYQDSQKGLFLMELTIDIHKKLYYRMVLTRQFELAADELFRAKKMHGTSHFCVGEEATGVGVGVALSDSDYITQTHRGHAQSIGKGMSVKRMMAEFFGKADGYCKGKGGSMHMADFALGSLGANGIVGGGIPIATGAAITQQYRQTGNIVVSYFGDGASNTGAFHEALNLASVKKLPIIFVCTNNLYGMSTPQHESMNIDDISKRAISYGIKGLTIDGNDVIRVYQETLKAKEYVLEHGPMLMVLETYRWLGHSKSDAQVYRSQDEVKQWKLKCPIDRHRKYLLEHSILTTQELQEIDSLVAQEIQDSLEFAQMSPEPTFESIFEDVYAD